MYLPFYRKLTLLMALLFSVTLAANAQTPYFERAPTNRLRVDASMTKHIRKLSFYNLKATQLRTYLAKAPLEFTKSGTPLPLAIPLPNGTVETFDMVESPVLAPEIAAKHPEIKTYNGQGQIHKNYTIRVSFTALGFNAIILGVEGDAVYFDKVSTRQADQLYMTYFGRDAERPERVKPFGPASKCGSIDVDKPLFPNQTPDKGARKQGVLNNTGTVIRSFRLAVAANGEFTQRPAYGGNRNLAFAGVVNYVNRLKAVYKAELSVEFVLVSDVSAVYSNTATDPYTNDDQSAMLDENQANLDALIGKANYDVGHVFGFLGGSGGGVASRGSVCNDTTKAQGVSGVGSGASFAPIFDDQLFCHEIGHQFGMTHSYNSSIPVCTSRIAETSVEPGAGITIMSYGFTCDEEPNDDNYEQPAYGPFLNFHSVSFEQAEAHIAKISCFTSRPFDNTTPTITMPANRTIPKSTPFALAGSATDDDADLTYSWEGTNIGTIVPNGTTLVNTAQPPFFRSYEPISTGTRTFPRLAAVLDGSNYARGDKLPSVGIVTTHRLTVRDGFGGVAYKEMSVTVAGNSGPFLETTNLAGQYPGNTVKTITWSVANTTAAPVSCATVNILLSTDGGLTFPTTLVANTPNDGSQSVTLPAVSTNQARIKIASGNNIFFDISNTNFTIGSGVPVIGLTAPDSIAREGGAGSNQVSKSRVLRRNRATADDDLPEGDFAVFRFARDNADDSLTFDYEITGSAVGDGFLVFDSKETFAVGELEFDLLVFPGDDLLTEGDETLTFTIIDDVHYDVDPADSSASILILDADTSPAPFSITAVTTLSCTPVGNRINISFNPQYAGLTGNPITFSVVNELAATTNPGPYSLSLYADNPVITLKATQPGTAGEVTFNYNWLAACNGPAPPNPTGPFAITSVTTVGCTPVGNRINLTFNPQYGGVNGQPISFRVVNELAATTNPGPYTLSLFADNPVINLRATQSGTAGEATFSYNWLAACTGNPPANTAPTVANAIPAQSATVGQAFSYVIPANTFTDAQTPNSLVLSVSGLPAGLSFTAPATISGTPSTTVGSPVTVTVRATDPGSLSVSTTFAITVSPAGTMPNPTGPFAITSVTTVSCTTLSAGERSLTFNPQYAGITGQPISFRVMNELAATTASGPYTLRLYTDNPVIGLRATQSGTAGEATFSYNWLAACTGTGARIGTESVAPLQVRVLGNPILDGQVNVEVSGVVGQPLEFHLTDVRGQLIEARRVNKAGALEVQRFGISSRLAGVLLLRVTTSTQGKTVKILKAE